MLGVSLAYFMVLLDTTVLSVAEPDLSRTLHSSMAGLQWTVTGYTVVFGALLLSAGAVADRYGAHRVFRGGTLAFGVGSLACALAPNVWTLVALRGALGVAAAAIVPASMAVITTLHPEPGRRAKAVAGWAATSGAALAAGPMLGRWLVDLAGWRSVFLINVPVAVTVLVLTLGGAMRSPGKHRSIDWPAQVAAGAALGLLTATLIDVESGSVRTALPAIVGAVAAAAVFVVRDRHGHAPVLPPAVLAAPGMRAALVAGAAVNFAMSGLLFVLPLLLGQDLHMAAGRTGVALLPMTLPFAVNPLLTGRLVARIGPRAPVLAGLGLLTTASVVFASAAVVSPRSYPVMVVGLLCTGFGVSMALPALVSSVVTAAPAGSAGTAGGLLNSTRQVGATLGVATMGAFATVSPSETSETAGHIAVAMLLCGAVCAGAALGSARRAR